jgi:hypothetical protein
VVTEVDHSMSLKFNSATGNNPEPNQFSALIIYSSEVFVIIFIGFQLAVLQVIETKVLLQFVIFPIRAARSALAT